MPRKTAEPQTDRPERIETRADAEQEAAHEWSQMTESQRKQWRDQGDYIGVRADNLMARVKVTSKPEPQPEPQQEP